MSSKSPSPAARLEQVRDELVEVLDHLAALPDRPLPNDEAIARAAALIDGLAASFQAPHKVRAFAQLGTDLAQRDLLTPLAFNQGQLQTKVEAGPLLAWLFGDQIKQRMADEIAALELPDALPSAERERERQRLLNLVDDLQIAEERAIRALEDEGAEIDRRPAAPISLILAPDCELSEHPPLEAAA